MSDTPRTDAAESGATGFVRMNFARILERECAALQAVVDELRQASLVPGVVHCAKCSFRLVRTNLYVRSGTTGPGDSATEPCPNGCGPLWPVTWEQEAREGYKRAEEQCERAIAAEAQVEESARRLAKVKS